MTKSNKLLILGICFIFKIPLSAQEFNWNCNGSINFQKDKDLLVSLQHYNQYKSTGGIFLIDYVPHDDTSVFFILEDMDMFALFYKKPDCFSFYNKNIIYLYTPLYTQPKDTLWLQQLFDLTIVTLRQIIGEVHISWANDSILTKNISLMYPVSFEPLYVEYHVYNGTIAKRISHPLRDYFYKMYYPDTGYPKGIYNKYDKIKYYESLPIREK